MISTSGYALIKKDAIDALKTYLLPISSLITPNIPEAELLSGMSIRNDNDMLATAEKILDSFHCSVLVKGGHSINDANDLLCTKEGFRWFKGKRINNPNTHGTGCTLSSAITSNLAKGHDLETSVELAKEYISAALSYMLDLGQGSGPMNHAFNLTDQFSK